MALTARRISRHEYEARRRDRQMIAFDLAALAIGCLLLATGVGTIAAVEPKVAPAEWTVSFSEEETIFKVCAIASQSNPPCDYRPLNARGANEGERASSTIHVLADRSEPLKATGGGSVGGQNATAFIIQVTWTEPTEWDAQRKFPPQAATDEPGSWDVMELEVVPPPGSGLEPRVEQATSSHRNPGGMYGSIRMVYNVTERPAAFNVTAMSHEEATRKAALQPTTLGTGEWTVRATLLRAGDVNGTLPNDVCRAAGVEQRPQQLEKHCKTGKAQDDLEGAGAGTTGAFRHGYEDTRQEWILDFVVVHWNARVT